MARLGYQGFVGTGGKAQLPGVDKHHTFGEDGLSVEEVPDAAIEECLTVSGFWREDAPAASAESQDGSESPQLPAVSPEPSDEGDQQAPAETGSPAGETPTDSSGDSSPTTPTEPTTGKKKSIPTA